LAAALSEELGEVGLQIPKFIIENISVPPEVEQAMDKRTQMGVLGNLNQYTQFQAANALEDAANNPGGGAGEGIGLGLGMAVGQRAAAAMATPAPPPLPTQQQWYVAVNNEQQGPYEVAALPPLTPTTLVWHT